VPYCQNTLLQTAFLAIFASTHYQISVIGPDRK